MKKLILKAFNRSIIAFDRLLTRKKKDEVDYSKVDHPTHYNIQGRKECIEEMIDKFGIFQVRIFCLLNAYKYDYRHQMKGGDEDLAKAEWYMKKYAELGGDVVE